MKTLTLLLFQKVSWYGLKEILLSFRNLVQSLHVSVGSSFH